MQNLKVKETGFIYKGDFYSLQGGAELSICEETILIDNETEEKYFSLSSLPKDKLFKTKTIYAITRGFGSLERFDTREEAEDFIKEATSLIK